MLQFIVNSVTGNRRQSNGFHDIFYTEKSSILGAGDMSFHVVAGEGPTTEFENMNSGSNVYKMLDKTSCTYFEESVPEPFSVQSSIAHLVRY